jgi:hypothetical protein
MKSHCLNTNEFLFDQFMHDPRNCNSLKDVLIFLHRVSLSQTADDKVTAEFKLRFSPDGDAPSDPLDKLRTKLESDGLVEGEKIFLQHVSLLNGE